MPYASLLLTWLDFPHLEIPGAAVTNKITTKTKSEGLEAGLSRDFPNSGLPQLRNTLE